MAFHCLELIFTDTWHFDGEGDLRLVGRLMARRWSGKHHAGLEVLEKCWDTGSEPPCAFWRTHQLSPSADQVERLVARIRAAWAGGRAPQVTFETTANTAYDGLVLAVELDDMKGILQASPLDGLTGPGRDAVCGLLESVADVVGPLHAVQRMLGSVVGSAGPLKGKSACQGQTQT